MSFRSCVIAFLGLLCIAFDPLTGTAQQLLDPQAMRLAIQTLSTLRYQSPLLNETVAQGSITEHGETGTVTIRTKRESAKYEFAISGQNSTTTIANGKGTVTRNGKDYPVPAWIVDWSRPDHIPALSRLRDVTSPSTRLELIGTETISNRPTYHLKISAVPTDNTSPELLERISEFHVFIDQTTSVVVKTISYDMSPDAMENRIPVETYYSDYKLVDGIPLPFHLTRYLMGRVQYEMVFTSIRLGVATSDGSF